MVFAARQLQEKCQEQNSNLYMTSMDLTKAFNSQLGGPLAKKRIMAKFSCADKFIAMIQQHDGMLAHIVGDGKSSEPFPVTSGVKQGCVLAPTFFNMMVSVVFTDTFHDCDTGIDINYHTDGKLLNLRRLQAKMKLQEVTVHDLLFADDCFLNAKSESDMQWSMDHFSSACDNFGLTINTKKTEVMHHPAPGKTYVEPIITVNGQTLQAVDKFTYLSSTPSCAVHSDNETDARIAKASVAFNRVHANVWEYRGISQHTKLKVYKVTVLPILVYA
ncbi:hypothetical protein Y1Q_0021420 [Alligator mississippiensis]|uniref:Reverse transcriptase domain-containing protein n=1 Tax=Alligator mississippiensis TaxID=8496 RepID=A0A151P9J9_ALLMI|nr:hypothetical protein Y1Q_0021420 [Alligator mississippiensis]